MPPKRKVAIEVADSSSAASTDTSDTSDSLPTPQTRLRRTNNAANTRRSTRLSTQAEPKPRTRLTRGLRSATPPAPTPPPKRARGRPRNVQPVLSDDEPTVGRQTRVTRNNKRTQAISTDSSEDTSDNEKDRLTSNSEDESDVAADEQSPLEAAPPVRRRRGRPPRKPPVHVQDSESEDIEVPAATTDEPEQAKVSAGQEGTEDEEEEEEEEEAEAEAEAEAEENDDEEDEVEEEDAVEMDDEQEEEEEAEVSSQEEEISPVLARPAGKRGRPKSQPANPQHPTPTVVSTPDVFQDQSDSDVSDDASTTAQGNLTRRQRSKLTRAYDSELLELPVEAKRSKFSAEEAALRKSEHARRRKFQSMQRAEQLKNDTINRLLNKQTSKGRNKVTEDSETRSVSDEPMDAPLGIIRYVQRVVEVQDKKEARVDRLLALPRDVEISRVLPGAGCSLEYPQPSKMCSVSGCEEKKKYSVDAMAACSLKHWRMLKSEQTGMVKQK